MNAYKVETVLSEDGTLMLKGLPFHAGDAVEVIILERGNYITQHRERMTAFEAARKYAGAVEEPEDLSTNPKYMEGFGE